MKLWRRQVIYSTDTNNILCKAHLWLFFDTRHYEEDIDLLPPSLNQNHVTNGLCKTWSLSKVLPLLVTLASSPLSSSDSALSIASCNIFRA